MGTHLLVGRLLLLLTKNLHPSQKARINSFEFHSRLKPIRQNQDKPFGSFLVMLKQPRAENEHRKMMD